jgi:hypothetical protein|tara:strand:- start:284 stop:475 length:192 start_codon:yes stop_codon:yes gene_type:complete
MQELKHHFKSFDSFEDYEECLENEVDIKRFRVLPYNKKIEEMREVDELSHYATSNTEYSWDMY